MQFQKVPNSNLNGFKNLAMLGWDEGGVGGEKAREGRRGREREGGTSPLTASFCCGGYCTSRSGAGCEVGSVLWSEELQLVGDGVGDGCSGGR